MFGHQAAAEFLGAGEQQLDRIPDSSTRLITRVRSRYGWLSPAITFSALVGFGDVWMMHKMPLNLRDRAEPASP